MTTSSDSQLTFYPKILFEKYSPTYNRWARLTIADIYHRLQSRPLYGDIWFFLNHPIKWIRIVGVVVSLDEYEKRTLMTIDDGSGEVIDAVAYTDDYTIYGNMTRSAETVAAPSLHGVRTNVVVIVKGTAEMFRQRLQILVRRVRIVQDTREEVKCWQEMVEWKRAVLMKPWVVDRKVLAKERKKFETTVMGKRRGDPEDPAKDLKKRKQVDPHRRRGRRQNESSDIAEHPKYQIAEYAAVIETGSHTGDGLFQPPYARDYKEFAPALKAGPILNKGQPQPLQVRDYKDLEFPPIVRPYPSTDDTVLPPQCARNHQNFELPSIVKTGSPPAKGPLRPTRVSDYHDLDFGPTVKIELNPLKVDDYKDLEFPPVVRSSLLLNEPLPQHNHSRIYREIDLPPANTSRNSHTPYFSIQTSSYSSGPNKKPSSYRTMLPTASSAPPPQAISTRILKPCILNHLRTTSALTTSLRGLLAIPLLSPPSAPSVVSISTAIQSLVSDGYLLPPASAGDDKYIFVGLPQLKSCIDAAAKSVAKKRKGRDRDVTVKSVWMRAREKGGVWAAVGKDVVAEVMGEYLDNSGWEVVGGGTGKWRWKG